LPPELVSLFVLWLLVRCDGDTNEEYLLLSWDLEDFLHLSRDGYEAGV
jgi:hypothetical protein